MTGIGLHLRGEVRDIWFDWLRDNRPDLIPRYEELYARRIPADGGARAARRPDEARPPDEPTGFRGRDPAPSRLSKEPAQAAQPKLF